MRNRLYGGVRGRRFRPPPTRSGYLSVQETAHKWGVSVRWVNQYILAGRIPGCERLGHTCAVPEDAIKPEQLTPGVKPKHVPAEEKSGG